MAETYEPERPIRAHYADPLDVVWLAFARRMGLTVRRSPDVYATHDGRGALTLSDRSGFDPDDTVAQMVFHEVCHWIVNGVETFAEPDWGFELDWTVDWREYTCQRLQAALAKEHGLARLLASTGTYRAYYDAVLADPLAPLDDSADEAQAVDQTHLALARAAQEPWAPHLERALRATAALQAALADHLDDYAPDHDTALPLIWTRVGGQDR
jgi:thioredoxin-like negative regulator of GroEL